MSSDSFGFLNVHKPPAVTSHDIVAKVRRALKVKKVGHAGTLDPLATGVLIVCLGAATRLSEYVMHATKRYRARVHLGIATTTYDREGEITAERDASALTRAQVEAALTAFIGEIDQIPPMFSAIKQDGRKLYELARAGEVVERAPRRIQINALMLTAWEPPYCTLDVTCSAGTYIRSLAHDLGEALGVGAHLAELTRTASGHFTLENAVALDTLLNAADWQSYLISPRMALADWPLLHLDDARADDVLHGRAIPAAAPLDRLTLAYNARGDLIAILKNEDDGTLWRPEKVFIPSQ